jgi:hypothetical protein
MIRSDRWGMPRPRGRGLLVQRMLYRHNLKVDCGGAVTGAAMALRNGICAAAFTPFDFDQALRNKMFALVLAPLKSPAFSENRATAHACQSQCMRPLSSLTGAAQVDGRQGGELRKRNRL